jgi:glycogen debranching enzyme
MISLPGLTLCAGRPEITGLILETFAKYVSQGRLPNNLPDGLAWSLKSFNHWSYVTRVY